MKKWRIVILSIFILMTLSACDLGQPQIGVTTYPIEYLVKRIAGDKVSVLNISESKTITRAQLIENPVEALESLDVLFVLGKLEPYMTVHVDTFNQLDLTMIDLSASASVYAFQRYETNYVNGTRVTLESPYYKSSLFDQVDQYQTDPYLWLDPITMISMASTITQWLVAQYPEERTLFEKNYQSLSLELARMDADYQDLWDLELSFVSITPSFGNWQKAFGINVYPLMLSRYGVLPSEAQLQFILDEIKKSGVQYIVHEPNLTEDMEALYERVKTELKLESVEMHTLTFLTEDDLTQNKNYIGIMLENLSTLERMLPITYAEETETTNP